MSEELIQRAAKALARSRNTVALTGAGISIESGIPPFRGKGGVWEKIDPSYADIATFMRDPARVWEVLIKEMKTVIDGSAPNPAHMGLVELEKQGILRAVITQNVDGLHQRAGNTDVIEFHGNFAWQRCLDCEARVKTAAIDVSRMPPRCHCGGIYRPDCVFFGEMIPPNELRRSTALSAACDVMLVIGTSAVVQPAASMPNIAKEHGALVIEINPEPTPLTGFVSDFLIQGTAGEMMTALVAAVHAELA